MMFQKIAKHRANDASLTMHRPPLHGDGDGGGDFIDGDLGDFIDGDLGENEYLFIVGVFGIRSLGDVSGRDDVRGVF